MKTEKDKLQEAVRKWAAAKLRLNALDAAFRELQMLRENPSLAFKVEYDEANAKFILAEAALLTAARVLPVGGSIYFGKTETYGKRKGRALSKEQK